METLALSRVNRVKRRQAKALAGEHRSAVDPAATCDSISTPAYQPSSATFEVATADEVAMYREDFLALLPVARAMYGYSEADSRSLVETHLPADVDLLTDHKALASLRLTSREWMIDLISKDLCHMVGSSLEYRARSTFRQFVMGEDCDENGKPYPGMWLKELARLSSSSPRNIEA